MFNQVLFSQARPSSLQKSGKLKDEIITYPSDNRKYKYLELENGLRVLLIEHDRAQLSEAVLEVSAGLFHQPPEFPGLAHFLEHMLFKGSVKYPEEGEYQSFIKSHFGRYSAFTYEETTKYSFTIPHGELSAALDRLSQFFIQPLFNEEYALRELQVIDQEFKEKLKTDNFIMSNVDKLYSNPNHPYYRFGIGNLETLKEEEINKIIPAMKAFHETQYSADKMILVLTSKYPLLILEKFVRSFFSAIPKRANMEKKEMDELRYIPKKMGLRLHIKSIEERSFLTVRFILTQESTPTFMLALAVMRFALESQAQGGIVDYLKQHGFIDNGTAANAPCGTNQSSLALECNLTEKGFAHIDEIVNHVFKYIDFLKTDGVMQKFHNDVQALHKHNLKFNADTRNTTDEFILNLKELPIDRAYVGFMAPVEYSSLEHTYAAQLSALTPENLRLIIMDKKLESKQFEPITHAPFRVSAHTAEQLELWTKKQAELPFSLYEFKLGKPNTAYRFVRYKSKHPILLHNEERLRIWFSEDYHFLKHDIKTEFLLKSHFSRDSVLHACLFQIYANIVNEMLKNQGMNYISLNVCPQGLIFTITGYDIRSIESLPVYQYRPTEEVFLLAKEAYLTDMISQEKQDPFAYCDYYLRVLLNTYEYSDVEKSETLKSVDYKQLIEFIELYLSSASIEIYTHGNIAATTLLESAGRVFNQFKHGFKDLAHPQNKVARLPFGAHYYELKSMQDNNRLLLFFQSSNSDRKSIALLWLLNAIIEPAFFNQLRTIEKLAYALGCDTTMGESLIGLRFVIQSPKYSSSHLLLRLEDFIQGFKRELEDISLEYFESKKGILIKGVRDLTGSPFSPSDWADAFKLRFEEGSYSFHEYYEMTEVIRMLTLPMLKAFYVELLGEQTQRKLIVKSEEPIKPKNAHPISHDCKNNWPFLPSYREKGEKYIQSLMQSANRGFSYPSSLDDLHLAQTKHVPLNPENADIKTKSRRKSL